jgi:geranylgeranyl reductase family protein
MDHKTAIIGAGPAGSMLAYKLASGGGRVHLYDHRAPWEKPCGGMLSAGAIDANPELQRYPYPTRRCHAMVHISPGNDRIRLPAQPPNHVVSRIELNRYLLGMAQKAGAQFIQKKVRHVSLKKTQWTIELDGGGQKADIIVGADGVNSNIRKTIIGKFPRAHLSLTCGYLLDGIPENQFIAKFLDIEGYLWVYSRTNHTSAGIGATLGSVSGKDLIKKLDDFLRENYSGFTILKKYSALIPTVSDERFFDRPCCGDNWLLVGDAAGHVDPVVGEGIYYAFESANAAAQAISRGDICSYDTLWRTRYGDRLKQRAAFKHKLSNLVRKFGPEISGAIRFGEFV